jgi:nucleoside-diphosphate-sugar epimerase
MQMRPGVHPVNGVSQLEGRRMAILVTGGVGFVGANIVKDLAARGYEVVSLDVLQPDELMTGFLGELAGRVQFITGSILDVSALDALRSEHNVEKVVHAAVFTVNRTALETARSKDILDINLTGTGNLLELARLSGVERFVYISSGAAYGLTRDPDQTYNEDDPPQPGNLYGITKFSSELLARRYGELHGFDTVSLRLSTPYGPMERITGHRGNMSTPYQWTGQMLRGEPIESNDSDHGRDYTYVLDTASAVSTIVDAADLPHDLYNVTNGMPVTEGQIQRTLTELFPETRLVPSNTADMGASSLGPTRGPLSGYRLWHDLGWTPRYDLASGLADYVRWRQESEFLD